jgi:hypothetical protein
LAVCAAAAQTGVIAGEVVTRGTGQPLSYSAITIAERSIARLTDDAGRFRLVNVRAGRIRIVARHVGFLPETTEVRIAPGETAQVHVELEQVAFMLAPVRVGDGRCHAPGAPGKSELGIAAAFEQLQLNAQQLALLGTRYPFATTIVRHFDRQLERTRLPGAGGHSTPTVDTLNAAIRVDTIVLRSNAPWHYEPGRVVGPDLSRQNGTHIVFGVRIPTVVVFTDPDFIANHCFWNRGVVERDGQRLLRIDFRASDDIQTSDLDGAMYLDSATAVIRESVISLSRPSPYASSFDSSVVTTWFAEFLPGVPIVAATIGINYFTSEAGRDSGPGRQAKGMRSLSDVETQYATVISLEPGVDSTLSALAPFAGASKATGRPRRILGAFDANTGAAVSGASIVDSLSGWSALTTSTGTIDLSFLPEMFTMIRVEKPGYKPQRLFVGLTSPDFTPITILLEKQ